MKTVMRANAQSEMYTVTTAWSLIIQWGIESVFNDPGNWYAKENNEKSLVYHWSLKPIEAFR